MPLNTRYKQSELTRTGPGDVGLTEVFQRRMVRMKHLSRVHPPYVGQKDEDVEKPKDNVSISSESTNDLKCASSRRFQWRDFLCALSLILLLLQYSSHLLFTRYVTTREGQPKFHRTAAVFFNEVLKLAAALVFYYFSAGSMKHFFQGLHIHFIRNWLDTLKVGIPALIYTVQNFLLYVGVENLDVTYQLRILTTAFFTVALLGRRLSIVQWISLLILTGGVALVQISAEGNKATITVPPQSLNFTDSETDDLIETLMNSTTASPHVHQEHIQRPWLGFAAVLSACVLSGFAGIYFEKILKGSDVSLWMRNIQLAALALPISMIMMATIDGKGILDKGLMVGFDHLVWTTISLQAFGGIVVAIVIKYADNILKAFASSLAIILSTVASMFLFGTVPKWLFVVGALLVIGSLVLYSAFPYGRPTGDGDEPTTDDETDADRPSMVDVVLVNHRSSIGSDTSLSTAGPDERVNQSSCPV